MTKVHKNFPNCTSSKWIISGFFKTVKKMSSHAIRRQRTLQGYSLEIIILIYDNLIYIYICIKNIWRTLQLVKEDKYTPILTRQII